MRLEASGAAVWTGCRALGAWAREGECAGKVLRGRCGQRQCDVVDAEGGAQHAPKPARTQLGVDAVASVRQGAAEVVPGEGASTGTARSNPRHRAAERS